MTCKTRTFLSPGLALLLLGACSDGEDPSFQDSDATTQAVCAWDEDDEESAAAALSLGQPVEGYLCPVADQDWYSFELPSTIAQVSLELVDAPIAPVNPTWGIWDGAGNAVASPAAGEAAEAGAPLTVAHGIGSGTWLLSVRDAGSDNEDLYHPYRLTVQGLTDPDTQEPNDDAAGATPVAGELTGYIAYRGDADWYAITPPERGLLSVRLTMPAGGIEPSFQVLDPNGEALITQTNPAGGREDTDLRFTQSVTVAGVHHVVVTDDDDLSWDGQTAYQLQVTAVSDPDVNEPNDNPDEATELDPLTCGGGWDAATPIEGYLAATGDSDWYHLPLSSCDRGIVEADVVIDDSTPLPEGLQAEVRMVREVANEACVIDQDCQELSLACGEDLDCAWIGTTCLASGYCAGAGVCLPTGNCGANQLIESADFGTPERASLNAPIQALSELWLAVADFQSDTLSPDHPYMLDVRVRTDPDPHEPSEHYTGGPPEDNEAVRHAAYASTIPVHDCSLGYDCCDGSTWVRGSLGYDYDQDWYRYEHPCPDEDCMVRIVYEIDGGPVDHYFRLFAGYGLWFDTVTGLEEQADQPAVVDHFGGLDPSDTCFYAFQDHDGSPYYYHIAIRDTVYMSGNPTGGTWDHDSDQEYRICVEKVADSCMSPCYDWPDGCGPPK